jgi:hypothetical protein
MLKPLVKAPDSVLNIGVDWSDWLNTGDTILLSTWESDGDITLSRQSNTSTVGICVISGGILGQTYKIKNKITTTPGNLADERYVSVHIGYTTL